MAKKPLGILSDIGVSVANKELLPIIDSQWSSPRGAYYEFAILNTQACTVIVNGHMTNVLDANQGIEIYENDVEIQSIKIVEPDINFKWSGKYGAWSEVASKGVRANVGKSTANQELLPIINSEWSAKRGKYYEFSFLNTQACTVIINGKDTNVLDADQGFKITNNDFKIESLVIVQANIDYKWAGKYGA